MEKWTDFTSDYRNLRIFGCAAYVHHKDDKLGVRALKCVFLGYPEGTKGNKLWCIEDGNEKLITTRNVMFNESSFPWENAESSEQVRDDFIAADMKLEDMEDSMGEEATPRLISGKKRSLTYAGKGVITKEDVEAAMEGIPG